VTNPNPKLSTKIDYEKQILQLADEMASNISSLNNHTYESFIASRDKLEEVLKEAFSE
jgi:hypothetical protein